MANCKSFGRNEDLKIERTNGMIKTVNTGAKEIDKRKKKKRRRREMSHIIKLLIVLFPLAWIQLFIRSFVSFPVIYIL